MIKIGIYDRYLTTAGGGERYSCKMAEILSRQKGYEVDLVTDIYSDLEAVEKHLNLDLSRVNLKIFPFLSEEYARKVTKDYDVFINSTYLSSLSAFAKRNLYLCYFPTPFDVDFKFLHRLLLVFFRHPAIWLYRFSSSLNRKDFNSIDIIEGIYDIKRFFLRRGSWTSGKSSIIFKDPGRNIVIGVKNPLNSGIEIMKCSVRLSIKGKDDLLFNRLYKLKKGDRRSVEIEIPVKKTSISNPELRLDIISDTFSPQEAGGIKEKDTRRLGCVVYNEQKIGVLKKVILKILGFVPLFLISFPKDMKFLESYDRIISISKYSAKWIKRFWKRESTILYPPVDTHNIKPGKKQKIILSVGRFFPYHHNKKQFELAQCFIDLYKNHKDIFSDYRLYLVGGVENKQEHLDYVERIEKISSGYPIRIFKNLPWEKLLEIFSIASVFWHASGLGEDEKKHPEKFEHFGITTVEAMAAGCIPVVINNGGQSEIIREGYNGFLFKDIMELKEKTLMICNEEIDKEIIRNNAIESSGKFSNINFEKDLLSLISLEINEM
jgi:glycosyltransferase involved in cell wall biosynthesis